MKIFSAPLVRFALAAGLATGLASAADPGGVGEAGGSAVSGKVFDVAAAAERIDALVEGKLAEQKLKPNAPIDDAVFLRRAYLDLIGRIPMIEEAEAFHRS